MPSWRRGKSGHMKSQHSIMPENYKEFISLTLRTRNSKKPSRMLARNWKRQWLPQCLARQARTVSMERPVVNPKRSNQNLRVFWKPVNPQDCVWKNLYRIIMRTILQEKGTIHCNNKNLVHKMYSYASKPWRCPQQRQKWKRNWKIWKDSGVRRDESQK